MKFEEHSCTKAADKEPKVLNYYDDKQSRTIYFCHYCGEEIKPVNNEAGQPTTKNHV